MLNLVGPSGAERAKSITIGVLVGLLMLSFWQLSIENAQANREDHSRRAAVDIARRFASALTTYDYAHPNMQLTAVVAISSTAVQERVRAASSDVVAARATSLGEVSDAFITNLTASKADVLLETTQVVGGGYAETGTTLRGLLDVTVSQSGRGWTVVNFRWLLAPSGSV